MKSMLFVVLLLLPQLGWAMDKADRVLVVKSQAKLYLQCGGVVLKQYHIALGSQPKGPKQRQGDHRTPEGSYILDLKNPGSAFYKSIRISYPNASDRVRARRAGVHPGGWIMIHGQKNGYGHLAHINQRFNWTDGCIAVTNEAMDEIWQAVDIGTPIDIRP